MKTVFIGTQPLKPYKPKNDHNSTKSKVFGSNIKNVDNVSPTKISQIVKSKNFRDTGNIFFIKFQQKQHNFLPKLNSLISSQEKRSIDNMYMPDQASKKVNQHSNFFKPHPIYEDESDSQTTREKNKAPDFNVEAKDRNDIKSLQNHQKTLYFYKKQSLNTQIQFFKAYNRYQKSRTLDASSSFNAQLIRVQKSFNTKMIKPTLFQRRSVSVVRKQKSAQKQKQKQKQKMPQINKAKQLEDLHKKLQLIKNSNRQRKMRESGKRRHRMKDQAFTPWKVAQDHHYHYE